MFAAGDPFAFTGLPLVDCGDGFSWRSCDETLRCWLADGTFTFEVYTGGLWLPVEPLAVRHAAAEVSFGKCYSGLPMRASGSALPTALLAEGESWTLTQAVAVGKALGGAPEVALGTAIARVTLDIDDPSLWASVKRVLAVLPSGTTGAFVGLGELVRDAAGVKVIFDNKGVTYATG